jgi:aspartokinase-like uncharacterized kinase
MGSTCRLTEAPLEPPHVTVRTVPGGTHFFPMLRPDDARQALADSAA